MKTSLSNKPRKSAPGRSKDSGEVSGPKAERFKSGLLFEDAIGMSLAKQKPKDGWPKPGK